MLRGVRGSLTKAMACVSGIGEKGSTELEKALQAHTKSI